MKSRAALKAARKLAGHVDTPSPSGLISSADRYVICALVENAPFKPLIWDWQFVESGAERNCIVARCGPEIVGFNGVIPVRIWDGTAQRQAMWSCDFVVRVDFRRYGVGMSIKRRLHEATACLMSVGVSDSAAHVLLRSGWRELPGPMLMTFEHQPSKVRRPLRKAMSRWPRRTRSEPALAVQLSVRDTLPSAACCDALWKRARAGIKACVVRDYEYLRWRYERHPTGSYRYVVVYNGSRLDAMAVVRESSSHVLLVDYIGPLDWHWLHAFVSNLPGQFPGAMKFVSRVSDKRLVDALESAGWKKRRTRTRFFVRDAKAGTADEWYLTPGDSDGEALAAARTLVPQYVVEEWSEREFLENAGKWDSLLLQSNADKLFESHAWQSSWWRIFGRGTGASLTVLAAYDETRSLVGLCALVMRNISHGGFIVTKRLQLLGHLWRGPATMRTEYAAFVARRDQEQPVAHALAAHILSLPEWDEFVVEDVPFGSSTFNALHSVLGRRTYVRNLSDYRRGFAWSVDTSGDFETYKAALSGDFRRKMFSHRSRLSSSGTLEIEVHESDDVEAHLDLLNHLHERRWGDSVYTGIWREFHLSIAHSFGRQGRPRFEILKLNGAPISILYNFVAHNDVYNIQCGFEEDVAAQTVSVGLVHLGYSIEAAFADPHLRQYNLLAGSGKKEFFKHRFCNTGVSLAKLHYVRSPLHRLLFRIRDARARDNRSSDSRRVPEIDGIARARLGQIDSSGAAQEE